MIKLTLTVNGKTINADVEPYTSLLDFLRDGLGFKGVKICCDTGECGACTILMNGKLVNSCVVEAAGADEAQIVTIEGVAQGGRLHPVQEAFIETGASQCGYCTPGLIMTSKALLEENPNPTMDEIKEYIAGNICRCTGYTKIFEAVQLAASRMSGRER